MTNWLARTMNPETPAAIVGRGEFDALARRVAELESRLSFVEHARPTSDQARWWYRPADFAGDARPDLASLTGPLVPWVSTVSRITGELTGASFARQSWTDSLLFGAVGALAGCGIALAFELPWQLAPIGGGVAFGLSASVILIHRRALLGKVVSQQGRGRNRQELDIIVRPSAEVDYPSPIKRLLVAGITTTQLLEFARTAPTSPSLSVHAWTGRGALFSQGQHAALMEAMLSAGYVEASAGNVARRLNDRGKEYCAAVVRMLG